MKSRLQTLLFLVAFLACAPLVGAEPATKSVEPKGTAASNQDTDASTLRGPKEEARIAEILARFPLSRWPEEKPAWTNFFAGVTVLQETGDRKRAAAFFEKIAEEFTKSRYAEEAKELALLLRQMVIEDGKWIEPPGGAPGGNAAETVAYFVYHLRDVRCYQFGDPGMCSVLGDWGKFMAPTNAATQLLGLGEPALPALIGLLEDRRPIRSVGYFRHYASHRTVLRYQDAAVQILNAMMPVALYHRSSTSAYFSNEKPEVREATIKAIKAWYEQARGKTEDQWIWLAVNSQLPVDELLRLSSRLAEEFDQRQAVLDTLMKYSQTRYAAQLPQLTGLMCALGDRRNVEVVTKAYAAEPSDSAARMTYDFAASARVIILYGSEAQRAEFKRYCQTADPALGREIVFFREMLNLAGERWWARLKNEPTQYPVDLLAQYLTDKTPSESRYGPRRCDAAAGAIQWVTGRAFGYDERMSEPEKDRVIQFMAEWVKSR